MTREFAKNFAKNFGRGFGINQIFRLLKLWINETNKGEQIDNLNCSKDGFTNYCC